MTKRVGGLPVVLAVGAWCSPTVFALLFDADARDPFVLLWPAFLLGVALLVAWQAPAVLAPGVVARVTFFYAAATWVTAEVVVDPVYGWGAHDPHGPPMAMIRAHLVHLAALLAAAMGITALPRAAPPKLSQAMPALALGALGLSAASIYTPRPDAEVRSVEVDETLIELDDGTDLIIERRGERLVVERWEPFERGWPACGAPAPASVTVVRRPSLAVVLFDRGEAGGCGFTPRGVETLARAHDGAGPPPHYPLVVTFLLITALVTLAAIGKWMHVRWLARRVHLGAAGTFVPDRGIVLEDGRTLSVAGAAPSPGSVIVLDQAEPRPAYRDDAAARATAWRSGDRTSLLEKLADQTDALEWLSFAAGMTTLAMAVVAGRF